MRLTELCGLTCRIVRPVDRPEPPQAVVIFCHGFGAGGDDLVPLGPQIAHLEPSLAESVLFVFPEAPLTVPEVPGGRAWWQIDIMALQQAAQLGEFRKLRQQKPPEMPDAREKLMALVKALQEQTGQPLSKFVLGGFSQGAMLTTDVALRLPENVGGLVIFSGTLLTESEWRTLALNRSGLNVFQSHGTIDPVLPHEAAVWLRDLLTEAGANVEFTSFDGMHTIPRDGLTTAAAMVRQVVESSTG